MRTAGLGSGARQTAPAEWLRPDDRADLVAVDIDVADRRARGNMRGHAVDARVDAERQAVTRGVDRVDERVEFARSEEHTSELQSLMRISYAVFCLTTQNTITTLHTPII